MLNYILLNNKRSPCITITLPENLLNEINNKRGCLSKSKACQILLKSALTSIPGPLIQNIFGDNAHEQ